MATISVEGNLTGDIELRVSESGNAYAYGRVIENSSAKNPDGTRTQLRPLGYDLMMFGHLAENAANSLAKGTRVVVTGTYGPNDYDTDNGHVERTRIVVKTIAPSLRFATATVVPNPKTPVDEQIDDAPEDPWASDAERFASKASTAK